MNIGKIFIAIILSLLVIEVDAQIDFECCTLQQDQDLYDYFTTNGFCQIPITIVEDVVPTAFQGGGTNSNVQASSVVTGVYDYANLFIIIDGELVDLEQNYVEVIQSVTGGEAYITTDLNFCQEGQELSFFESELADEGTIWFHIYNGQHGQVLFFNWTDLAGEENTFGLEYLCDAPFPADYTESNVVCSPSGTFNINSSGEYLSVDPLSSLKISSLTDNYLFNHPDHDSGLACAWVDFKLNSPPNILQCDFPFVRFHTDGIITDIYNNTTGLEWKVWGARHRYTYKNSNAGSGGSGFYALLDFTFRVLITEYDPCADFINYNGESNLLQQEEISHFYVNDENIAFNVYDFGNYLWGGAMRILGFSKEDAQWWANWNEEHHHNHPDSPFDQLAIGYGHDSQ